jgi:type II secretory pathway predicted ATPase ExeA
MSTTGSFDWKDESEDHLLFGDSDMDFFFEEGHREQHVEHLRKLSQLDELFVFVLGATGVGKTSLLHEFIRRHADDCAYIEVPILADTITLLDSITKQCEILMPANSDIDHYIYSIRNFIQENHRNDRKFILVVDDADGLPDDALRALLKLISKAGAPHFIFSSHDASLQNRINALVPFYQTHTLEIKTLSEAEVVSYIDLYLAAYHLDNDFSDDDIYDIFLSSNGNMAEINKSISTSIDGRMQVDSADYHERTQKVSGLQIPRLHIMAVVMAIIGLGALGIYFMNHTTTTANKPAELTIVTNPTTPSSDGALKVETKVVTAPKEILIATQVPATASAQQGQIVDASKAVTITPTQAAAKPTTMPTATSVTASGWLAKAPESNFTIQIMASDSKDSVTKLINQQTNSKDWGYYETTRNGKPWFVAVYGNYASKEAAKAAVDKLPAGLKEGKPWLKAISAIHSEMKR